MIRVTIEMLPMGYELNKYTLGLIEISNDGTGDAQRGNYKVILKKTPPWRGALKHQWRAAKMDELREDAEIITGGVVGFDRHKRGPYDLLFRALKACGMHKRNPRGANV